MYMRIILLFFLQAVSDQYMSTQSIYFPLTSSLPLFPLHCAPYLGLTIVGLILHLYGL